MATHWGICSAGKISHDFSGCFAHNESRKSPGNFIICHFRLILAEYFEGIHVSFLKKKKRAAIIIDIDIYNKGHALLSVCELRGVLTTVLIKYTAQKAAVNGNSSYYD